MIDKTVNFQMAFEALPGNTLLLEPNAPQFTILAISDELLRLSAQNRADVVGNSVFDVFPEYSAAVTADGPSTLRASLQNSLRTKQPERLTLICYDESDAEGAVEARYWSAHTKPVLNSAGEVQYLIHTTEDITAQVRTQQRAQENESRFRNVVEQAPVAITLTRGLDVVIESINTPMLRMLGKATAAEVLGKMMVEVLPHVGSQVILEMAKAVTETGQAFRGNEVPIKMLSDNGELEQRYYNVSYTPLIEAGLVTGVIHLAIDVTEQVRARQEVEEHSEELKRFKFMADQARDPFILMREDGSFAYLNHKALEALGYTEEEAQNLRVPDVDAIHDQEGFAQLFALAQRETIPKVETMHKRKNGQLFPVEVSLAGLLLGGKPHLFAIPRDITQQKKFTEALRESEERFRIMADATPNLVWAVHPDSTIRYVNKAFVEFVGVSMEEYATTGWSAYLPEEELEFAQKTLTEAIRSRTIYSMEHRMRRQDGEYRWLLAQGAPSYYPNGEIYGYVGSAIDITELKKANEQLVRINNDLDNFVYTASHDLKAPISNIEGLLHALLRTPSTESMQSEQVQQLLGMMQESVERFTKTIANLTDIVKLQKENKEETVQIQLAEVIEHVLLDLEAQRALADAHVEVEVTACPVIRFSAKNLRSVVFNLLSNALKYRSPDRALRVQLQCSVTPEYDVLSVTDNGLGIESGRLDQLFTMFKRFHDHVEGSGIGLYMVKKMVENAGGKIEVETEAGVGSTFRVYFPH
ncbi:PAS domain-containing sensor histidine kinase [Hymenobacter radiodurans]|uniref:PAS domain-containing sensor histidine kinase n=1 Tax=Hymenobacter radiodurans TaxID=2496028 RepID=UPI001059193C|nr:PAS domain S-box protein [Hymenobacter radiodurans]